MTSFSFCSAILIVVLLCVAVKCDVFQDEILEAHNLARSIHGSPPMTWDEKLAERATEWAKLLRNLPLAGYSVYNETVQETWGKNTYGENIYVLKGGPDLVDQTPNGGGKTATKYWYSEISAFDWDKPRYRAATQFTQVVYKSSTTLGCGTSFGSSKIFLNDRKKRYTVVCHYAPKGNYYQPSYVSLCNNVHKPVQFGDDVPEDFRHNLKPSASSPDPCNKA